MPPQNWRANLQGRFSDIVRIDNIIMVVLVKTGISANVVRGIRQRLVQWGVGGYEVETEEPS